jgi:hypothetical protein
MRAATARAPLLLLGVGAVLALAAGVPASHATESDRQSGPHLVDARGRLPGARVLVAAPAPAMIGAPAPAAVPSNAGSRTSAIVPGSVNRSSMALRATYSVSASLRYGSRALTVDTSIGVQNTSGASIDRLELNTIAARLGQFVLAVATVDGKAVVVSRSDQTLIVPLGGVLPPGSSATVRIRYRATLRSTLYGSNWMFTRTNGVVDLYRWIPWISRTTPFNRPNHGDPFVTPVSPSVRVTITTDRPLVIATTGHRIATSGLTQTFAAENVRDFTVSASPYYHVTTTTVGATQVRVFTLPGGPASTLRTWAARALSRMSRLVGTYPYSTFTVAQTAGGYGMESPTFIWIPHGAVNLAYLISHETAHQWFYGLVGNDQARQPFTDEAAADFLARYTLSMRRASRCSTARLDLTIYQYSSACYYEDIYIQGGNFLDGLRQRMGSTAFWRALRGYVAEHRYGLVGERTLLDAIDAGTPLNFVPRYRLRFPKYY